MSAYINRYFLLMAVFLPLWCIIRRPWKHWSLHEGCLMAFATLLFSLLCLVLRGTWAAPGDMLASALHRLRTGEGIQLRLFRTITRQLRYARHEEMLINIWGNILLFIPYGFFLPLLCEFASLLGYHAYLKMRYLLQMHYGAGALAIVIVIAAVFTAAQLHPMQRRKYS